MPYRSLHLVLVIALLIAPQAALSQAALSPEAPPELVELGRDLNEIMDDPDYREAHWGMLVVNPETGDTLYTRNAHKNFTPASNVKLFTSAAILDQLGPDYTYFTEVWANGEISDGTLYGDLVIRGSGDPTIGDEEFSEQEPTAIFQAWADTLQMQGINRIEGSIIGDDTLIDDTPLGRGWSWSDVPGRFAAEIGGLTFNLNLVEFKLEGQVPNMPVRISWEPHNTTYIDVRNETRSTARGGSMSIDIDRELGTNIFQHRSEIPSGRSYQQQYSITRPAQYFTHVLREVFEQNGIEVRGATIQAAQAQQPPTYLGPDWRRISGYESAPLSEIMKRLNKDSQNLYAELALRTLGAVAPRGNDEDPGSAEMGILSSNRTLHRAEADTSRMRLVDGSGLSRYNLVSPAVTSTLLSYMYHHSDEDIRDSFIESLPLSGVDGTLEYRLRTGHVYRNVRAKTGTLGGVSALSGYTETTRGEPLIFVIMVNGYRSGTSTIRRAQDRMVRRIVRFPR